MNLDPESSLRESKFDPELKIKNWPWVIIQIQKKKKKSTSSQNSNLTLSQCHQNVSSWSTLKRLHPTKFLPGTLSEGSIPTTFPLGNSTELYPYINFSLRQFYRIVFLKYFLQEDSPKSYYTKISWSNSAKLYSQNIHFKITLCSCIPTFCFRATLRSCISTKLPSKQFYGIVFSKYFLWDNSADLNSQNIFFEATLRSFILTLPIQTTLCFISTLSFEATLQSCILKTFHLRQLCGLVFSQHFFFEAILRNCILKTFLLRQLCGIVFSKYSFWGNFTKLYSQNISFEVTLRSCILQTLPLRQFYRIVFSKPSPLRQFCEIIFSHFLFWDNFAELHSHKCLRTIYPHVNKLMVTK